jgi:ABC-type transporter Mla MlaB component
MKFTAVHADRKNIVTIAGELTISFAEELKKMLLEALGSADEVSLKIEELGAVDLACLQVLCSAHRSAVRSGKTLMFSMPPPPLFRAVVADAGYARLTECSMSQDKSCLWHTMERTSPG